MPTATTNHLGNVSVVVSDRVQPIATPGSATTIRDFSAEVSTIADYHAFGTYARTFNSPVSSYRYGFNGKELDNEMFGLGNELDYGMRVYDPRAGRFLSVDPLQKKYPELTPYQFASNSPIDGTDLDGRERIDQRILQDKDGNTQLQTTATGPASKRYFHSFWEVSKVPPHYRVEFNQQHYWFAASTDASSIHLKHDGRLHIPIYSLEQYERFVQNPQAFDLVSEQQSTRAESRRIMFEGAEMALVALATHSPGMLGAMRVRTKPKSSPLTNVNKQAAASNNTSNSTDQSKSTNGIVDPTQNRVKLRKGTIQKIHENQPRNDKGEMIDPNTKKPLKPDETDIGHTPGNEWRKRKRMHKEKGSTRKQVIEEENNPTLYQLEDRHENRSRKHEKKD